MNTQNKNHTTTDTITTTVDTTKVVKSGNRKSSGYKDISKINERIKAKVIELIDHEGKHYATYDKYEAIQLARSVGLSLVEIKYNAIKPLCKILDFGKVQYNKSKQNNANRKQQKTKEKEVQISSVIAYNDLLRMCERGKQALQEHCKLRIVLTFTRRTALYKPMDNMNFIIDFLKEFGKIIQQPTTEGRKSICVLTPIAGKSQIDKTDQRNLIDDNNNDINNDNNNENNNDINDINYDIEE